MNAKLDFKKMVVFIRVLNFLNAKDFIKMMNSIKIMNFISMMSFISRINFINVKVYIEVNHFNIWKEWQTQDICLKPCWICRSEPLVLSSARPLSFCQPEKQQAKVKEISDDALLNQGLFIFHDKYQIFPIDQLKLYMKMDKLIVIK